MTSCFSLSYRRLRHFMNNVRRCSPLLSSLQRRAVCLHPVAPPASSPSRPLYRLQQQHKVQPARNMATATQFYNFKPLDKKGQPYDFSQLQGKVVLIVNTASKCGFTPQFEGLEALYQKIKATPQGADFEILGFPCNQFNGQDPGTDDEIQSFCQVNYGVTFPVLGKTDVNGDKAAPLYDWLKSEKPGLLGLKRIKWNFEKFLVGRNGQVLERWASTARPAGLEQSIQQALQAEAASRESKA